MVVEGSAAVVKVGYVLVFVLVDVKVDDQLLETVATVGRIVVVVKAVAVVGLGTAGLVVFVVVGIDLGEALVNVIVVAVVSVVEEGVVMDGVEVSDSIVDKEGVAGLIVVALGRAEREGVQFVLRV